MEKLTGLKKIKTAVFISGSGSNLKNLIIFSKLKKSPISIDIIISDNSKAKGLIFGKIYKIKTKVFDFKNKNIAEKRVLLELTNVGFTREQAYSLVQKNAMHSWNTNSSFYENIANDSKINKKIPVNKLKKLFDFSYHTKRIDIIFKRNLKK